MDQSLMMKQRELTDRLSRYCYEYYSAGAPSVSDAVYDRLFDELAALEQNTGIQLAGSPTVNVGFPVAEKLEKTSHEIPLLSMEKVKSSEELQQFIGDRQVMFMLKLDGLTIKLTYENGELVEAATRGDGDVGQVVTHNARSIRGIPAHISYQERLVVAGEAFIRPRDFEELKTSATDGNGETYKNGRNLAAGSIQLLDSKECFKRRLMFMPFQVLEGYADLPRKSDRLYELGSLGFCPCKFMVSNRTLRLDEIEDGIDRLRTYARDYDIPIDGIVVTYNDVPFAKSCGRTRHHYKDSLAFKFKDEMYETVLQSIEWTPGRTGEIAPVAVFRPVTIEGCQVCRASLHNLSFIENLQLMPGNRILVSKRNMIIPHVEANLDVGVFSLDAVVPRQCPCCGAKTRVHESSSKDEDGVEHMVRTLFCDNESCATRRLKQFAHFVSKKAMDIEGLSEARLEKLISRGWLHSFPDIYRLDQHRAEIVQMEGFGDKIWRHLWETIQKSRITTFQQFVVAMDIPMVGRTASTALCQVFHGSLDEMRDAVSSGYDFRQIPNFGDMLHSNIHAWFACEENFCLWDDLQAMVEIQKQNQPCTEEASPKGPFAGKTIVVTGKVEPYTRDEMNSLIVSLGAVVGSSVTWKTDFLVCGEKPGSKLSKARELGVQILAADDFFRLAKVS